MLVGYGQCEAGATIATETAKTRHSDASVGIPLPGINLRVVDDNFNELSYYERGQILADTPCRMIGYYNNKQATDEYFYTDKNGVKWNCTGDVGYIDKNGQLYIEGRTSDFTIVNDKKIYNFDIENCLRKIPGIKNCDVLSKKSDNGQEELVVHIILDESYNNACGCDYLEDIQKHIYDTFGDVDYVPYIFKIRKSFPYAPSGKRDVNKMKNETDGFIEINKYTVETKKKTIN